MDTVDLTPKQIQEKFSYHPKTLSRWADEGLIEYIKSSKEFLVVNIDTTN
ncbi:MAG: hypothetical protein MGF17_16400 [Trichodesmium sp. MAG_R04]|nr:hypothetical protein [Trichodesmium sp. MAG_R04]